MFNWSSKPSNTPPSLEELITSNRCVMFSMPSCPWCVKAEDFLKAKKLKCHTVNLQESQFLAFEVMKTTGQKTVPNIFIDGQHVGGHDALLGAYEKCQKGKTDDVYCPFFKGCKRVSK